MTYRVGNRRGIASSGRRRAAIRFREADKRPASDAAQAFFYVGGAGHFGLRPGGGHCLIRRSVESLRCAT
jgi:hypothetical protein